MEQKHEKQLEVEGQHNSIKSPLWDKQAGLRNLHSKAAWFPKAGLGLFLHWGISAVHGEVDLSWGMIAGWELVKQDVCAEQLADMMQRNCYSIEGTEITPSQYFSAAKDFKGEHYNPREWIRLAKQMGATYAVLTTRHHDGFALWPSHYGDFNTKN
ncbi:MAG: alpha-L-fucosidase [Ruthenibacterium sp.]